MGDLLRYINEIRADETMLAELGGELKELYGHNRAKRYLSQDMPTEEELLQLIAKAETRCLDQLVTEDEP